MLGWMQRQVIQMLYDPYKNQLVGTSLVVQWLRLCAPNAGGRGLIQVRELKPTCFNQKSHMLQ